MSRVPTSTPEIRGPETASAFLPASHESATAPTPEVRALPPPPPLLAPLKTEYAWTGRPFITHPVPRNAEVVTLADEPTETSGRGTGWPCHHGMDQIGGRRCIECCSSKPQHYVLLVARGGRPARYRWLCSPCLSLARDLIRMEDEAKRLERNGEYGAAQYVWAERDRLREFRSSLLRTQLRLRERRT